MQETLKLIRNHLEKGAFANEAAISHQAVTPVLAKLGWEIFDPAEVVPEYTTAISGRVDYALCIDDSPRIFVEVKQAGTFQKGEQQLLKYACEASIEMAVLTDGKRWSIYLSMYRAPFPERRVELVDIEDRCKEAAAILTCYLGRDATQSGANIKAATKQLRSAKRRTKAIDNIPSAWASLLEEQDGPIAESLTERVEENTGVAPVEWAIQDFLDQVARVSQGIKPGSAPVRDAAPRTVQAHPRSVALSASQVFDISAESNFHDVRHAKTTKLYRQRWLAFADWCESNEYCWLPANPEHIVGWLEAKWPRFAASSLTVDLSAIKLVHEAQGEANPVGRGSPPRQCLVRLKQKEAESS